MELRYVWSLIFPAPAVFQVYHMGLSCFGWTKILRRSGEQLKEIGLWALLQCVAGICGTAVWFISVSNLPGFFHVLRTVLSVPYVTL